MWHLRLKSVHNRKFTISTATETTSHDRSARRTVNPHRTSAVGQRMTDEIKEQAPVAQAFVVAKFSHTKS